eukprot:363324-Chlamydomonas_euryale.AAC.16
MRYSLSWLAWMSVKTSDTAIGMMPGAPSPPPRIVCVLPLLVWPYANTVPLKPDTTLATMPRVVASKMACGRADLLDVVDLQKGETFPMSRGNVPSGTSCWTWCSTEDGSMSGEEATHLRVALRPKHMVQRVFPVEAVSCDRHNGAAIHTPCTAIRRLNLAEGTDTYAHAAGAWTTGV